MAIRFPRMHIAESVVNRILNVANDVQVPQNAPPSIPASPNLIQQGAQLDQALMAPVGDVAPVDNVEDALVGKALDL